MNKPVVTIGIPTGDYFSIVRPTALSFMKMIAYTMNNGICSKIQMESAASPTTDRNRNQLVGAMDEDSEFLLQIDADMTFPENQLERMLETYEKIYEKEKKPFVLSGLGFMGSPPYYPAMFYAVNKIGKTLERVSPEKNSEYAGWVPVVDIPNEVFEVDAIGSFGFLVPYQLFNVFKGYGGWFNHHVEMDAKVPGKFLEIRHDLAFSMRVREAGYKIFVDPSIEFGHIRPRPVMREIWEGKMGGKKFPQSLKDQFSLEQFRARHLENAFGWQLHQAETDGMREPSSDSRYPIDTK